MNTPPSPEALVRHRIANVNASCTTAAALTALGALGASGLPGLAEATRLMSDGGRAYHPPKFTDYIAVPFLRRAPIDVRIERIAAAAGINVRSSTRPCLVPWRLRGPGAGEVVIGNMAFGQEAPGRTGSWGFNLLRPRTWAEGGHSLIIAARRGRGYDVVDSNIDGVQHWARRGLAATSTRVRLVE